MPQPKVTFWDYLLLAVLFVGLVFIYFRIALPYYP